MGHKKYSRTVRRLLARAKALKRRRSRRRRKGDVISKLKKHLAKVKEKAKERRDQRLAKSKRPTKAERKARKKEIIRKVKSTQEKVARKIETSGRTASRIMEKIRSTTPQAKIEQKIAPRVSQARRSGREAVRGAVTGVATETIRHPVKAVASAGLGFATGGVSKAISTTRAGATIFRTAGMGLTGIYAVEKGKEVKAQPDAFARGQVVGGALATEIAPFGVGYQKGQRGYQVAKGFYETIGKKEMPGLTPKRDPGTFPSADPQKHAEIFRKGKHLREKASPIVKELPRGEIPVSHTTGKAFDPKGTLGKGIRGFKGFYTGVEPSSHFARITPKGLTIPRLYKPTFKTLPQGTDPRVYIGGIKGVVKPKAKTTGAKIREFESKKLGKKGFLTEETMEIEAVIKPQKYKTEPTGYYTKIEGVRVPVEKIKFKGKEISSEFAISKRKPIPRKVKRIKRRRYKDDSYSITQETGYGYRPTKRTTPTDRPTRRDKPYTPTYTPPRRTGRTTDVYTPTYTPPRRTGRTTDVYTPRRITKRESPTPTPPTYPRPRISSRAGAKLLPKKKKLKVLQPKEYKPTVYAITRGIKATKKARKKGKRLTKSGLGARPTY